MKLLYKYSKTTKDLSFDEFWEEKSGDFDKDDSLHVVYMLKALKQKLNLDEYALKRLESSIKTELPFFASKRLIARKWLENNFYM